MPTQKFAVEDARKLLADNNYILGQSSTADMAPRLRARIKAALTVIDCEQNGRVYRAEVDDQGDITVVVDHRATRARANA